MPMCEPGMAGMVGMSALSIGFWGLLGFGALAATIWAMSRFASGFRQPWALASGGEIPTARVTPEEILRERYASGEIDIETLERMLTELYRDRSAPSGVPRAGE